MKYLILTNNHGPLLEHLAEMNSHIDVVEVEGNIRDVAFMARDYLMGDYTLVADPLAGRLERPTPYLTIILQPKNPQKDTTAKDILRVEYFVTSYCKNQEFLESLTEKHKMDYREIDTSLTKGCCLQMTMGK